MASIAEVLKAQGLERSSASLEETMVLVEKVLHDQPRRQVN